ncbi:sensor histidine kinase [Neoaquamicrobium sediminum]|uniref:sensor histidine kinase n=1 Tax=Neoaquamicrobium sediminum TaxID=1849104 RepID=UPI0015655E2B|nr:cache domain-containing protein [Mesorhizobium sediminum]NRC53511.1 sensor histidine kinase [Mesorhizobium sediminum]
MPGFRFRRGLVAILALIASAASAVWFISLEAGKRRALAALDDELHVLARTVEGEIERFRYLPAVIARDRRILDVLASPEPATIERANAYLEAVRTDSGADELYVMKLDGLAVAASNHAEPTSFVGENYQYRPYFTDALARGEGRYYAVGATTGIPGYFLSSVIRDNGRIVGVAIVKVDMRKIEATWTDARSIVAVTDADGVVFLTGHAPWKYRPLQALSEETLFDLARTRKYGSADLASANPIFSDAGRLPETALVDGEDARRLVLQVGIEPDGWRLLGLASLAPIRANSLLLALLTALAGLLIAGAGLYMRQRRQLTRARLHAHAELERRVVERTAELNRQVEDRRRAEAELRQAQESLIQAAKLAALGRMSAAIVHEVSQPLAAMENTLASTGLLASRGDAAAVADKVRSARDLVRRIQRTVKLLKSFARNEPVRLEPVDVDKAMAVAVELARRAQPSRARRSSCANRRRLRVSLPTPHGWNR